MPAIQVVVRLAQARLAVLALALVALALGGLRGRAEAVGAEALQQRGHGLGLRQLGDLEVLLVVRRVFPDQTLLLHGEGRPLVLLLLVAPLAVLVVVLVPDPNDRLFSKVHGWLGEKRARLLVSILTHLVTGDKQMEDLETVCHLNVLHFHLVELLLLDRVAVCQVLPLRWSVPVLGGVGRQRAVGDLGVVALIGQIAESFLLNAEGWKQAAVSKRPQTVAKKAERAPNYRCISGLLSIRPGAEGFIPPLLNHLLHHLQLAGVWRGSALETLTDGHAVVSWVSPTKGPDPDPRPPTSTHSAFGCSLVILVLLLGFGLLLELDDRHPVQVAVGPTVVDAVLKQIFFQENKREGELRHSLRLRDAKNCANRNKLLRETAKLSVTETVSNIQGHVTCHFK